MGHEGVAGAGESRQQFLKKASMVSAGAFLALAATTANPFRDGMAFAQSQAAALSDVDILNFALTLEHLEAAFYTEVVASGRFSGTVLGYLTTIKSHELAHVATLTAVIKQFGGTPVPAQMHYNFGMLNSAAAMLALAERLEGTGMAAYTGAAGLITNDKNRATLIAAAGSIEQVEARHYATIRMLLEETPAPAAIGPIYTVAEVQTIVKPILGM
jgi:rubrerythrin